MPSSTTAGLDTPHYAVAVVGLGAMGLPMATRLTSKLSVHGFDISADRMQLASDAGRGPNRQIPREILERVPETRVAGRTDTNRLIFEAMLRRAGIVQPTQ